MPIQNILPDPNNTITPSGADSGSGSVAGPGFSAVSVTSQQPLVMNRSNSGLAFKSINKYQKFTVDIKYNALTKAEFNVVYPFFSAVITTFLPEQLTFDEIEKIVASITSKIGAEGMKDMGKVMGIASKEMAGKADGKTIS